MNSIKTIILLLLFSNLLFAQREGEDFSAKLVILNDINLKEVIKNINLDDYCINRGYVWFLNYKKDYLELSSISKYKLYGIKTNYYASMINNNLIFIRLNKENDSVFKKLGFKINLNDFKSNIISTGPHTTSWYFKEVKGKTELIKEDIYPCVYN